MITTPTFEPEGQWAAVLATATAVPLQEREYPHGRWRVRFTTYSRIVVKSARKLVRGAGPKARAVHLYELVRQLPARVQVRVGSGPLVNPITLTAAQRREVRFLGECDVEAEPGVFEISRADPTKSGWAVWRPAPHVFEYWDLHTRGGSNRGRWRWAACYAGLYSMLHRRKCDATADLQRLATECSRRLAVEAKHRELAREKPWVYEGLSLCTGGEA